MDKTQEALRMCGELEDTFRQMDVAAFDRLATAVMKANRVFVAGAGRTGLLMQSLAMVLTQLGLAVDVVGSATARSIRPGDLLLVGSSSGGTKTIRLFAETAKAEGAQLALITTKPASPIGQLADCVLALHSASDSGEARDSVNLMGAGFLQALNLLVDLLVSAVMAQTGATEAEMLDTHANLE